MAYKDPDVQREYQKQWAAGRRAEFFAGKCCSACGSTDRLELDHIDPSTKTSHSVWSWSEMRRLSEISKCQVLCHSCHKMKTKAGYFKPIEHGTRMGYRRRCRCAPCTAAAVSYNSRKRREVKARLVGEA